MESNTQKNKINSEEQIRFIDLFAGASGMSEGFVKAGFTPISHIEMDENACMTIRTRAGYHYLKEINNSSIYIAYLKGNITRKEFYDSIPNNILDSILNVEINDDSIQTIFNSVNNRLGGNKIDLIIGGPPCQAYSLLGRHQDEIEKDPRNKLYIQYGRFLKEFRPKVFVFENVPGMLSAAKGEHFKNLRSYFSEIGYKVHYKLLNSADFGVLQSRKRIIIVGWLKKHDKGFPEFEENLHNIFKTNDILSDLPRLKPGDTLNITGYAENTNEYLSQFEIRGNLDFVTQHICRPHNTRDLSIYKYVINKWNTNKARVKYTDIPENLRTHKNLSSFLDRFKVIDGDGVSHTIVAHIAKDGHYYIHPDLEQCRSISIREAARIQSFPDDFFFEGSRTAVFKQIGNAVPPLMSYAIAKEIKKML